MTSLTAPPVEALTGKAPIPGDKSISHRALILGGLALGETVIEGLLESGDVAATAAAMTALGATVARGSNGTWRVTGQGIGALREPEAVLNLGNSGTGARLLMGLVAGHPISAVFSGDASLSARPMGRVLRPLETMGARFIARGGDRLPLTITGTAEPLPIQYRLPVPSAQVKSAILLAGLSAPGQTSVIEAQATRDHSEIMLRHFGVEITVEAGEADDQVITMTGQAEITGQRLVVPADPSSAAFAIVAALVLPGSDLRLEGVCINPRRRGLIDTLREMGADLQIENTRQSCGEAIADLVVRSSALEGVEVPPERAPAMIDEYPILAVAAAAAKGKTVMSGLAELRVKESDRLSAMARGLAACGVTLEEGEDSLVIEGAGGRPRGGGRIAAGLDHRIAMSFLVLGLIAERPVTIDDAGPISTSFPGFVALMNGLGAAISPAAPEAA